MVECLLQMFKCQLLPPSLMEAEDYIESSGRYVIGYVMDSTAPSTSLADECNKPFDHFDIPQLACRSYPSFSSLPTDTILRRVCKRKLSIDILRLYKEIILILYSSGGIETLLTQKFLNSLLTSRYRRDTATISCKNIYAFYNEQDQKDLHMRSRLCTSEI